MINNDYNRGVTGRWRELLYEIHGDGIPRLCQNRKLFEESIRFVAHRFGVGTDGTQFAVVFYKDRKSRPVVVHPNLMICPEFLSKPSGLRVHRSDCLSRCSVEMGSSQS